MKKFFAIVVYVQENTADEDAIVVEKILGHRMRKFDKEVCVFTCYIIQD